MTDWHRSSSAGLPARAAARVCPTNEHDGTVLFCACDGNGNRSRCAPDIGADRGVVLREAALRELTAKTGISTDRSRRGMLASHREDSRRRTSAGITNLLVSGSHATPGSDAGIVDDLESDTMLVHRWWLSDASRRVPERRVHPDCPVGLQHCSMVVRRNNRSTSRRSRSQRFPAGADGPASMLG